MMAIDDSRSSLVKLISAGLDGDDGGNDSNIVVKRESEAVRRKDQRARLVSACFSRERASFAYLVHFAYLLLPLSHCRSYSYEIGSFASTYNMSDTIGALHSLHFLSIKQIPNPTKLETTRNNVLKQRR